MMLSMLVGAVNVYLFKNHFGSASMLSMAGLIQTAAYTSLVRRRLPQLVCCFPLSFGLREDGTVYAVYSFARKVGQALAGGIAAAWLSVQLVMMRLDPF